MMNFSSESIIAISNSNLKFILWAEERSLYAPKEISENHLIQFQRWTFLYRKKDGSPISPAYQHALLSRLKTFFRFLRKRQYIYTNPCADLTSPRRPELPPKQVLTPAEVEKCLKCINTDSLLGIRNRTLLELFYSTGARRKELQQCTTIDVDCQERVMTILYGKGGTRRRVPIGQRACLWLQRYLSEVRPQLLRGKDPGNLFLNSYGKPISKETMGRIVRKALNRAKVRKPGQCHLLRHAMATAMLDNGADIRHIQAILGHKKINSTQIYTHVSIKALKEVHARTHPARLYGIVDANLSENP